jgi:toxin ParE1/3/4
VSKYVLSSEALLDLDDIWGYIAQDDIEAADRWIAKLLNACQTLARNPHIGHHRAEITDTSVLLWPVGAYLVIYRGYLDHIEIVGVTQGARDIPSFVHR